MLSVVIPLRDEAESLATLAEELARVVESAAIGPAEFVFVDDGSTDTSWAVIAKLSHLDARIRGIRLRRNFGKAAALSAGFRASTGAIVVSLDGDLQDDPAEIPRFLEALETGLDLVSGWKKRRYDPWHKVGPSRLFNAVVSLATGCKLHDHNCGFKAYRRELIDEVNIYGELHRFIPPLAHARGYRVGEVVVNHRSRRFGRSKYGVARFLKGLLDLVTVVFLTRYGRRPLHAFGAVGVALGILGIVAAIVGTLAPSLPILAVGVALAAAAIPTIGLGLAAELLVHQRPEIDRTHSVAETIGHPLPEPADG